MADSPSEVWKMIKDLHSKSKTGAKSELQALQVTNAIKIIILSNSCDRVTKKNNDCDHGENDYDDNIDGSDNGDGNGDNSGQWSTITTIGSSSNYDDDHNDEFKKTIGLMIKTTALHVHHAF